MYLRKSTTTFLVLLLVFLVSSFAANFQISAESNEYKSGEFLIKYKNTGKYGFNSRSKSKELSKWSKVNVTDKNEYTNIINNPLVETVTPIVEYSLMLNPDDQYYASQGTFLAGQYDQWSLRKIGLNPVTDPPGGLSGWEIETGSTNTIIAIVDSGIDLTHPEFTNKLWINTIEANGATGVDDDNNGYIDDINGFNFYAKSLCVPTPLPGCNPSDFTNIQEQLSHGTYTAGIAAANSNNVTGIASVCWGCKIMVLKVFGAVNSTADPIVAEAIEYAVDNGANIINLSLGGPGFSQVTQDAVNYAVENDITVVASSGNDSTDSSFYSPAGLQNVITVNASNHNDVFSSGFSNLGLATDIIAPGQGVLTTKQNPTSGCVGAVKYGCFSGTSMSAPHVSGVAALLYSLHSEDITPWGYYEIRKALLSTAEDKGMAGYDTLYGFGRLNALSALSLSDPALGSATPTATFTEPPSNLFKGNIALNGSVNSTNLYAYYISFSIVGPDATTYMYTGRGNKSNTTLIDLDIDQPDGTYMANLIAEDFNGNRSDPDTLELIIDNTPPSVFNLTSPTTDWTNNDLPEFTWQSSTDVNGPVTYDILIDSVETYSDLSATSHTALSAIPSGNKQWRVRATDAAGNTTLSSNRNLRIDKIIPNNFTIGKTSLSATAILSFSTTDSLSGMSHYQISINGGSFSTVTSPYTTSALGDGTHSATVRAFDNVGNYREVTTTFQINAQQYFLKTKGDFNLDSAVNLSDLSILATYWNQSNNTADANNDGITNISDLSILAINWMQNF